MTNRCQRNRAYSLAQGEVAKLITKEQGKTLADAEGDVLRGLQASLDCLSHFDFEHPTHLPLNC